MNIELTWKTLTRWLEQNISQDLGLQPPATEAELEVLEQSIGLSIPNDLHRIYLVNNGQARSTTCGIFMGFFSMNSEEILESWRDWKEVYNWGEDFGDTHTSYPPDTVRAGYAVPTRLPFAHDYTGNYIGVDLDPGPAGVVGQVITFGRDEEVAYRIFESLGAFLEWLLRRYQNDEYRVIGYEDGERYIAPAIADLENFLDAVPRLFGPSAY